MGNKDSGRRGQTLPEALVAISVLMIGFLGMFALLAQSLGLNRVVTDNYAATYLATEGIEIVKNIIDSNRIAGRAWDSGLGDGTYEIQYDSAGLLANGNRTLTFDPVMKTYGYGGAGRATTFRRTVQITHVSGDHLRVVANVAWTSRGGSFDVSVEDHFYRWR